MATKGSGSFLSVGSALSGSGITISAATAATPVVLTTATNTFTAGDIAVVAGIVGPTNLNNRAFVLSPVTTSSATLKGEDGATGPNAAWVSGGTVQKWTMQRVGGVTKIAGFDGQSSEIDTTNLDSQAKEYLLGLQDFGNCTLNLLQITDAGQARIRAIKTLQLFVPMSITLSDGTVAAFLAGVKQYSFDGVAPDGAVTNSVTLRISNAPAWFA